MKKIPVLIIVLMLVCYSQISLCQVMVYLTQDDNISPDSIINIEDVPYPDKTKTDIEGIINNDYDDFDFKKVETLCDELIRTDDADWLIFYYKGICQYKREGFAEATAMLTTVLDNAQTSHFVRENVYRKKDDGYHFYKKGVWLVPTVAHALIYRATCKANLEDYIGAIQDATAYINLNKTIKPVCLWYHLYCHAFYLKGYCQYYQNKFAYAKANLTTYIKLQKGGGNTAKALMIRGSCNNRLGLKEESCLDWSRAGELGNSQAYEKIKEYCNK